MHFVEMAEESFITRSRRHDAAWDSEKTHVFLSNTTQNKSLKRICTVLKLANWSTL